MRVIRVLLLLPLLAVAVVSFVFVRAAQNDAAELIAAQRQAQTLTPAAVDRVVKTAPDPVTHRSGRRATCEPLGNGVLRNPWRCSISYESGRRTQYTVEVRANGGYIGTHLIVSYQGRSDAEPGSVTGCCVVVP